MDEKRGSDGKLVVDAVGEREIVMTRSFRAPRRLVFDAWTKPELVPRWMTGPGNWTMPVCKIDLRVGGAWRFILRGPDGRKMGMKGVYQEISAPDRLVSTESFDDGDDETPCGAQAMYAGEAINTLTLVERAGVTTATIHILSPTREARDGMLKSGMEKGVSVGFDRLDVIFAAQEEATA
jgi:uncharacterized protein YndB with AHSA1/START domain